MIKATALVLAFGLAAFGQTGARLAGSVKDPQGKPVSGAEVRLFRQDSNTPAGATTDETGKFTIERLLRGNFLVQVEKEGFRSFSSRVEVQSVENASVDVVLEVAGVNQTILVTAAGVPQKLEEISKAVSVVTAEELQNRNEYSLSDTLRTVPGLLVINGGGPGQNTSMRIRGLRADAAAVLVDGMRFRDSTTTQGDSSSFFSTLNLVAPERVEVLRGSGSSLYGSNAVGGVVNVVTQEGGGPLRGDVLAEGGGLGMIRGRANVSGGAWKDRLQFSGGLLHLNFLAGVDGNDRSRSTGGQGFGRFALTPAINVSARFWASDDFVQLNISPTTTGVPATNFPAAGIIPAIPLSPANVALLNAGGRPDYTGVSFIPGRDDPDNRRTSRFYTTAIVVRHALHARASWQASYQRVHTNRVFANGPAGTGSQPPVPNYSNYRGDIDTADAHTTLVLAPWVNLTAGYEFEHEAYSEVQLNNLPPPRTISERTRITQNSHTGYFATQLGLLQGRLHVSLSGRAQNYQLSRPGFEYAGAPSPYLTAPLPSPKTAFTGDSSAAYLIARSNTKLRAHLGNAYRAPSLYERFGAGFSNNPATGLVVFSGFGDPRLSSDRYNSADAGIDQYLLASRVRLSATYFYTRVVSITAFDSSGMVQVATDPFGRSSGYINGSGGISRGAELAFESRPMKNLSLAGSYTYVRENTDRDISVAGFWKILQVPSHVASLTATRRWGSRIDTTFYLSRYSTYYQSLFAATRSRAFEFPGFTKASLIGAYRVWQNDRSALRVYTKIDNVFNQRYYQNGWLAAKAIAVVGLGYTY